MKTVLLEKPADGKARLVELLGGFYVHNAKGSESNAKGGKEFDASKAAILFIEFQNEVRHGGASALEPVHRTLLRLRARAPSCPPALFCCAICSCGLTRLFLARPARRASSRRREARCTTLSRV